MAETGHYTGDIDGVLSDRTRNAIERYQRHNGLNVTGEPDQKLFDHLDPLMEFKPPFIDVTYHREEQIYKRRENGLLESKSIRKRPGTSG